MWPYWFFFLLTVGIAMARLRPVPLRLMNGNLPYSWWIVFILLVLLIGLRFKVGGDWETYLPKVLSASQQSLVETMAINDPAYGLLNWLGARSGLGIFFVNTICAALFSYGLIKFCRHQPLPWLALVVSIPYLIIVVGMGYTRQATAIGITMLGLVALSDRKLLKFMLLVALAATFHKSAVLIMPLAAFAGAKNRLQTMFWIVIFTLFAFVLLLQESIEALRYGYLEKEYQSSGTALRLLMNAIPATFFLFFRYRFQLPESERTFWTWMSLGAFVFLLLYAYLPSSTAVDRLALYWIPLQIFVISRLPSAIGRKNGRNAIIVLMVIFYSATVLFGWMMFSSYAEWWLPYQFYPWVMLWL